MIGITLSTISEINRFLSVHSIVLTIDNKKWHILTEDTFRVFRESLHYDIDYRIDGNFQFTNIIIMDKRDEIRITNKTAMTLINEMSVEEAKQIWS